MKEEGGKRKEERESSGASGLGSLGVEMNLET